MVKRRIRLRARERLTEFTSQADPKMLRIRDRLLRVMYVFLLSSWRNRIRTLRLDNSPSAWRPAIIIVKEQPCKLRRTPNATAEVAWLSYSFWLYRLYSNYLWAYTNSIHNSYRVNTIFWKMICFRTMLKRVRNLSGHIRISLKQVWTYQNKFKTSSNIS